MPDETAQTPLPVNEKLAAIKAWHDAKTDDDRRKVVQQYPILAQIYSGASNFIS